MICQSIILVLGAIAIYLVSRTDKLHRWGFVVGLISQPFWLYESYVNRQYGFFILSIWYMYVWINGIYKRFGGNSEI